MNQNPTENITGTVERIVFQSPENGFAVFVVQINKNNSTLVRGYLNSIQPGEQVNMQGAWVMHPKFGKQFEASSCTTSAPTNVVGLKKYLGSGMIKGIGPSYAEKLVNYFGTEVLDVIDKHPQRLREVDGIGEKRLDVITKAWQDQKEISTVMVFLQDKGISPAYAVKIYKKYGQGSIAILNENPYRLAEDIWGIGFKIADQIAQNMGFEPHSIKRIKAGILFAITTTLNNGHLYLELNKLKDITCELLELQLEETAHTIKNALHELYNSDKIKLISYEDEHFVTLTQYYFSEKGVAQKLQKLCDYPSNHPFDLDAIYASLRMPSHERDLALNEDQQRGILACLQNKVTVITGGPGTGKTTIIKKLLHVLDSAQLTYRLAAPTGRAAKRITESTHRKATTLHRLLEFDFATMGFLKNEQNALALDYLIIDEASMIDIFLAYAVLKAIPLNAHLVLIGDVDQLPSVGAGNFLNDCIASGKITSIRLKEIFRQAQDSLIIVNAHRINTGEFPVTSLPDAKRDFFFIKEDLPEKVAEHLDVIFTQKLAQFGIHPNDAMVLVPMNRGVVGTQNLNHHLQAVLNKTTSEKQVMNHGTTFKIGDRVMQLRNNYDKHVFNGDIGFIDDINTEDRMLLVKYDETIVDYEFSELDELVLAYAISIHKSQGSEYAVAIIPIFMQHFTLLQRNLIYTAITRAKKICIFIGQTRAIAMAIKNNKGTVRQTFLQQFLTTDLQCR
ncbi:MAG: ATP-dependent RecD-like DNA helicase [Candidatus Dependentiae bacterium]|nr:ATP-dependent RecD-like DNA helicase [Candidatus Dependentiae bacterium]